MKPKNSLIIILIAAVLGGLLSGYLSYYSLFTSGCSETFITCGENPVEIIGLPTCVYGLFMYVAVIIIALVAWNKDNKSGLMNSLVWLGVVGVLFSGSLSVYELFIQDVEVTALPACVYGFIFYALILVFAILGNRKKPHYDR